MLTKCLLKRLRGASEDLWVSGVGVSQGLSVTTPALVSQGGGWGGLAGIFVMAVVSFPIMTGVALQDGDGA